MPVYLVTINAWALTGYKSAMPELLGIVTSQPTAADAVAWTLTEQGEAFPRDIECELVSRSDQCWLALGPETDQ